MNILAYIISAAAEAAGSYFGLDRIQNLRDTYVAVSAPQTDLRNLHIAYEQSAQVLNHRFINLNRRFFRFGESEEENSDLSIPIDSLQEYVFALRSLNVDRCRRAIAAIFQNNEVVGTPIVLLVLSCLIEVASENGIEPKQIIPSDIYRMVGSAHTGSDLKNEFFLFSHTLIQLVRHDHKRHKKDMLNNILDYVDEHFSDPLSLTMLADLFHSSPSYISRLIKKELNVGFNQYLNHLRVREGTRLLMETDGIVRDIAHTVGYDTEHSFIRNFKKVQGKTPVEYKITTLTQNGVQPIPN